MAAIAATIANVWPTAHAQLFTRQAYSIFIPGPVAQYLVVSPKGGWVYFVGATTLGNTRSQPTLSIAPAARTARAMRFKADSGSSGAPMSC